MTDLPPLPFPPCPECGAPVDTIRPLTNPGRLIPLGPESAAGQADAYARENDRTIGHELTPCGHVVDGWQWQMQPVVTYGAVIPRPEP